MDYWENFFAHFVFYETKTKDRYILIVRDEKDRFVFKGRTVDISKILIDITSENHVCIGEKKTGTQIKKNNMLDLET